MKKLIVVLLLSLALVSVAPAADARKSCALASIIVQHMPAREAGLSAYTNFLVRDKIAEYDAINRRSGLTDYWFVPVPDGAYRVYAENKTGRRSCEPGSGCVPSYELNPSYPVRVESDQTWLFKVQLPGGYVQYVLRIGLNYACTEPGRE